MPLVPRRRRGSVEGHAGTANRAKGGFCCRCKQPRDGTLWARTKPVSSPARATLASLLDWWPPDDAYEDLPDGTPYPKATAADLEETVRRVEAQGRRCIALKADVGDPSQAASLVDRATRELGRLDYLITNAAVTIEGPITETRPETFDLVLRTNLHGVFNVLSPSLRVMAGQGRGRVIVIGSGSGRHAEANAAPYVASKWALIGLAKTAALEVAKSGVTVNVILPGPVDTPMMDNPIRYRQAVPDKPEPTRDDYLQVKKDATPMGTAWVKPEDVTAAVLFLLSDEARFISGETLSIDAGDSAHWT